jgi:hypothetical protein
MGHDDLIEHLLFAAFGIFAALWIAHSIWVHL